MLLQPAREQTIPDHPRMMMPFTGHFVFHVRKSQPRKLICPSKSTGKDYDSGYRQLARNICCLQQLDNMPMGINVSWLDDGRGVADTLLVNNG